MKNNMKRWLAMLLAAMLCTGCAGWALAEEGDFVAEEPITAPAVAEEAPASVAEEPAVPAAAEETPVEAEQEPEQASEAQPEAQPAAASEPVAATDEATAEELEAQPETAPANPWEDELAVPGLYRGSLTAEKASLVLRVQIKQKSQTLRLTTEKLAVKLTVTDLNGVTLKALAPIVVDNAYLPLNGTVELPRGVYLVKVEPAAKGLEGAFVLTAEVLPAETEQPAGEAPANDEPAAPAEESAPAEAETLPENEETEPVEEIVEVVVEAVETVETPEETGTEHVTETAETPSAPETAESAELEAPAELEPLAETAPAEAEPAPVTAESAEPGAEEEPAEEALAELIPVADEAAAETQTANPSAPTVVIESYVEEISTAGPSAVILLRVSVANAEGPYTIQWQYTPDGGETIIDVPNANGPEYRYVLDSETAQYGWRVMVTMLGGEAE